jgi:zinc transport system substrate-binding protein
MKKILLLFIYIYSYAYVSVSILPQKFVIDKITQNSIDVNVLIPKGASPAIYSPKPRDLIALKKSDVYFTIGVPFERAWLYKFKKINPKIVDFAKYIKKDKNPHIWLDPILLIQQAKVVYETLSNLYPKKREFFYRNFLNFKDECLKFDNYAKSHLNHQKFIIFHPNLYYFAKRYSLKEIALEKNGKEPTIKYLLQIIKIAQKYGIHLILTAPEFSHKSANFLANKIGAKVVEFSALEYDIFKNLKMVIELLNGKN